MVVLCLDSDESQVRLTRLVCWSITFFRNAFIFLSVSDCGWGSCFGSFGINRSTHCSSVRTKASGSWCCRWKCFLCNKRFRSNQPTTAGLFSRRKSPFLKALQPLTDASAAFFSDFTQGKSAYKVVPATLRNKQTTGRPDRQMSLLAAEYNLLPHWMSLLSL